MCFLGHDAGATKVRLCVGASVLAGKTLFGVPQSGEHCVTETSGGLAGSGPNTRVPSGRSRSHVQQQTAGKHSVVWWNVTLTIKRKGLPSFNSAFRREIFSHFLFPPEGHIRVRPNHMPPQATYQLKFTCEIFTFSFSSGTGLPLMVETYELLNDIFPFLSILDTGYPNLTFIWQISCFTLSSHLYWGLPCDLLVRGSQLNIYLTVLVSGILCTWPKQLSLWALI